MTLLSKPLFAYYDNEYDGSSSPLADPFSISDIRAVGITILLDIDSVGQDPDLTFESLVTVRNVKSNF